ncbi:hypothetical protein HMPREF0620_0521 [Parascardovia denticolens DSM 10105 = JCM 12538]|uniref:Uncharacterized protein n=1 Tax=Parascardovia denticolens DSM 10105 = JCM 12538 TaxID=864564 RepID=E6K135_PARDN|nr:hypothetical protein HMPREF0620_0521 [Parascardovia denticolens DSM 10105 = JCM 12538]
MVFIQSHSRCWKIIGCCHLPSFNPQILRFRETCISLVSSRCFIEPFLLHCFYQTVFIRLLSNRFSE